MRYLSALLMLIWVLLGVPASAGEWKTIRIGVEGAYPPFNYIDGNSRFQGFDVDIANALCDRVGATCEFVQQDWDDMIPALLAHKFDAIIASMAITEERRGAVEFTDKYYAASGAFVARRTTNLRDVEPEAMKGRVVGSQKKTTYARFLKDKYAPAGVMVRLYATQQEALLDLAGGRIDAVLAAKLIATSWLDTEQGTCCAIVGEDVRDKQYIGEGAGIAVRKEDSELRGRFNKALAEILADGTYKKINDKYFPFSIY